MKVLVSDRIVTCLRESAVVKKIGPKEHENLGRVRITGSGQDDV